MTTTATPYKAPVAPLAIRPTCDLCHGTGLDPAFGTDCVECIKAMRIPDTHGWHGTPAGKPAADQVKDPDLAAWLATQTWSDFATSLAKAHQRYGYLTPKQATAAQSMRAKCQARDAARAEQTKAADVAHAATPTKVEVDVRTIPSGRYAVPGADTRLKLQVDNLTEGKWAGWVFVKDAAEYGYGKKYGSARPGQGYRGDVEAELAAIAADPAAASAAYGRLTGTCGICGRHLEDADSVARGIGPVCAAKKGW